MIVIDGNAFNIGIASMVESTRFENLYEEMAADGTVHVRRIGSYIEYMLMLEPAFLPIETYNQFHYLISDPRINRTITLPMENETPKTIIGTFESFERRKIYLSPRSSFWSDLSIRIRTLEPSRRA